MRERHSPKYITRLEQVPQLNGDERERLQPVQDALLVVSKSGDDNDCCAASMRSAARHRKPDIRVVS